MKCVRTTSLAQVSTSNTPHCYEIVIKNLITKIPSHLVMNVTFLKFLFGELMFPDVNETSISETDTFPHLNIPHFNIYISILRCTYYGTTFTCRYCCTCRKAYSLFCQSLMSLTIDKWMLYISDFMQKSIQEETDPKFLITNFRGMYNLSPDDLFDYNNAITHLYLFLSDKNIEKCYRIKKNNIRIKITANPCYFTAQAKAALESLKRCKSQLPFVLSIECYPFFKI